MKRVCIALGLVFASGRLCAQTAAPVATAVPAAPVARLQQMESIYQKELSARHIPLLGKYLVELQRQAAAATDKAPYEAEIARVQQIISSGGVVDLIAAQQPQTGTMPMPPPPPVPPEGVKVTDSVNEAPDEGAAESTQMKYVPALTWLVVRLALVERLEEAHASVAVEAQLERTLRRGTKPPVVTCALKTPACGSITE